MTSSAATVMGARRSSPLRAALLCLLLLLPIAVLAQTPRVLVVGDSWADQQFGDQAHTMVFQANGFGHFTVRGANTVVSGSTAAEWTSSARLQSIADALAADPSIDTVQVTLGGNDFLGAWSITMSLQDEEALLNQIRVDLTLIVEFILEQRPDVEVILSFYDFPNFQDTLSSLAGLLFCRPLWQDLGEPTPLQLNLAAIRFEEAYALVAAAHPRIHQVSHFGLMQNAYGFPNQGIPPGQILPPGDPNRPSPVAAMRNLGTFIGRDCFHLTPAGYDILVQNLFEGYFYPRFDSPFRSSFE